MRRESEATDGEDWKRKKEFSGSECGASVRHVVPLLKIGPAFAAWYYANGQQFSSTYRV
jgi:hypothetical protein